MTESFIVIGFLIIMTIILGSTSRFIVNKISPHQTSQPRQPSMYQTIVSSAPTAFVIVGIITILLISSKSPLGYLVIVTGPATLVLGIMSLLHFVAKNRNKI